MKRNKFKKGYSLLEILLAITIFTAGGIVVASLMINANTTMRYAEETSKALLYAKEGIEAVKSIRDSKGFSYLTSGSHGVAIISGGWDFSGSSTLVESRYTRIISISAINATTSEVTSKIVWNFTDKKVNQVQLTTYLTNW